MKRRFLGISLLTASGFLLTGVIGLFQLSKVELAAAEGNDPVKLNICANNATFDIDLAPVSSNDIRTYYSSLSSLGTDELHGMNLLKNLKPILRQNSKYISYDDVWHAYCITDRNWNRSPASAISNYDAVTKKITGYSYGSGTNNYPDNPYLYVYYHNDNGSHPITIYQPGADSNGHHQNENGINREHMWPKSHGFNKETGCPAYTDLHHLFCAAGHSNNKHNNLCFGNVDPASSTKGKFDGELENYLGQDINNINTDSKHQTFMPYFDAAKGEDHRGDIARALFYMCARYNNYANDPAFKVVTESADGEPFLALTNDPSKISYSKEYGKDKNTPVYYGWLSYLLEWNRLDPPDDYEIHRNDLIYRNIQLNRNPFIDFPQWADLIWGEAAGSADPLIDGLHGGEPVSSTVPVTGVSLDATQATIIVGNDRQITAAISPSNASNKSVSFTSSDPAIATVMQSGLAAVVHGVKEGNADITVTTSDGGHEATCQVVVQAASSIFVPSPDSPKCAEETPTAPGSIRNGEYYITAPEKDAVQNSFILNAAKHDGCDFALTTTKGKVKGESISAFNYQKLDADIYRTSAFIVDKKVDTNPANYYLKNSNDSTQYLTWDSSTNMKWAVISPTDDTKQLFTFETGSSYGSASDSLTFAKVVGADPGRGLLVNATNDTNGNPYNTFGIYSESNKNKAYYTAVYFHRRDYAFNLLKDKLTTMTCDSMMEPAFHDRIVYLHDRLIDTDRAQLSSVFITGVNSETCTMEHAYNYAINRYVPPHASHAGDQHGEKMILPAVLTIGAVLFAGIGIHVAMERRRREH